MKRLDAEDLVRRAAAAFNANRPDEAHRLCKEGLAIQPNEPMLNHLLAAVLFAKGDAQAAHNHIETSLKYRPDNAAAHLLAARIARGVKDFDRAISHLDRVSATAPSPDVFLERARTFDLAGYRSQAREAWHAILTALPQHREAAARLGRFAWEDGDYAGAAALLDRAVADDAPSSTWFDLGLARQDLHDYDGAAAAYRKALEKKPDYAEAAVNLGIVLQEAGDLDGAMQAYREAYRLRPSTFGRIAMALTSASHGRLWLNEVSLRHSLGD